jgi:hypothetical protein
MKTPRVVAVFWGHFYVLNPDIVSAGRQLLIDLITGPFMNGLAQYGVGEGSFLGPIVVDTGPTNPEPGSANEIAVQDQLMNWLRSGVVSPSPATNEENLLYFIFPPPTTTLTLPDGKGGILTSPKDFCGYHTHTRFNTSSTRDDLFIGISATNGANRTSGKQFMLSISFCVSHECAEAFTNPGGEGFISSVNGCEIGDVCEQNAFFNYRTWTVEQYWSNWDKGCIRGDEPVSVRKFLGAIGFPLTNGLRSLHSPVINVQFIASVL